MEQRRHFLKKESISFRWFRNVFSLILLFLIAVGIVAVIFVNRGLSGNVTTYLDNRASIAGRFFKTYYVSSYNDFYATANLLMQELSDTENVEISIADADGAVVISTDGISSGEMLTLAEEHGMMTDPQTGEYTMRKTVLLRDHIGTVCGAISFRVSLAQLSSMQITTSVSLILALFVVAVLVFLSGLYFIRSIAMPVEKVISSAKQIATGDFSVRIKKEHRDEIGELTEAINHMGEELSKTDKLKNDFLSSVSHELRTPLAAIRGWNETVLMCDPEEDREMIEKGLHVIDLETERLSHMVEELLDYTKIQSGKFTISLSQVDLFTMVTETLEIYAQRAEQAQVVLTLHAPDFEPVVEGDPNRLKQVFINILDNAIKHSPAESEIEISFERYDKQIDGYGIVVLDHGSGIREEDLPFIKDRFYKGKSLKPGSGLGLAICDEVVRMHNGKLQIKSKENVGTRVTIALPAAQRKEM